MAETIELLAPARTADIGIEAIRHGADAVYIGPSRFGARVAAGNTTEDIHRLVCFAHPFGVRVYATLNTLLREEELPVAETLIRELYEAGVDALIVQDPAVAAIVHRLWPKGDGLRLHASTQMDNRTAEQVLALSGQGYEQVVLARELSLSDIAHIHQSCPQTRLEVFVHGALCVSLSGRCYASEVLCGRSANRGECAQICRLPFDLETANGTRLLHQQHLLSLKDLCHIDSLSELVEAGARSFKIEGRLKDMSYVKNVTAAYSQALDHLVAESDGRFQRASRGEVHLSFQPDVYKSFNRGFTHYFLYEQSGRQPEAAHIFAGTPKSIGEPVGQVVEIFPDSLLTDGQATFHNGDGLGFFDRQGHFHGFRVNRVEGNRLFFDPRPKGDKPPQTLLQRGTQLWRNYDKAFHDVLAKPSAERTLPLDMTLTQEGQRFILTGSEGGNTVSVFHEWSAPPARTPQADNLRQQLSRLGGTPFRLRNLQLDLPDNPFIPSSVVAAWRREVVEKLLHPAEEVPSAETSQKELPSCPTYLPTEDGTLSVPPPLMTCRFCLRHALGRCPRQGSSTTSTASPLYLRLAGGRRLALHFDCRQCIMIVDLV